MRFFLAVTVTLAGSIPSLAQDFLAESPEPYEILAQRMEIQRTSRGMVTSLLGNVRVRHGDMTITADRGEASDEEGWALLRGHVRIVSDTTVFTAEEGRYERTLRRATLTGDVHVVDGTRTVDCDRLVYQRDTETTEAEGDVRIHDGREKYTLTAGRGVHERRTRHSVVSEHPLLILENEKKPDSPITILSRTMETWDAERQAVAEGDVRVQRGEMLIRCQRVLFLRGENRAVLSGEPQVAERKSRLHASEIELWLRDNRIEKAALRGDATAVQARTDSLSHGEAGRDTLAPGEESQVRGDLILVYFQDEKIQRAVVTGNAESRYYPRDGGTNLAWGKTIALSFRDDRVAEVEILQEARGEYYPAQRSGNSAGRSP
jgi:lipopolysaccharide export system protein LptA